MKQTYNLINQRRVQEIIVATIYIEITMRGLEAQPLSQNQTLDIKQSPNTYEINRNFKLTGNGFQTLPKVNKF